MMMPCTNETVGELIALYEFGALKGRQLEAFLDHLIECQFCYDEVYRLEPFMTRFRRHREAVQGGAVPGNEAALEKVWQQLRARQAQDELIHRLAANIGLKYSLTVRRQLADGAWLKKRLQYGFANVAASDSGEPVGVVVIAGLSKESMVVYGPPIGDVDEAQMVATVHINQWFAEEQRRRAQVRARWRLWKPAFIAAMFIAIAATVIYLRPQWLAPRLGEQPPVVPTATEVTRTTPSPWDDLEIPKPEYAKMDSKLGVEFQRAMEAYTQDNFTGAADRLEALSRENLKDAAQVQFYLGACLLLAGQADKATEPLKRAVGLNGYETRERSHYYLALAYLKMNQPDRAVTHLDAMIALNGKLRVEAEKLKQRITTQR
jgi:tetratricopeptide (TPR) repeat protein